MVIGVFVTEDKTPLAIGCGPVDDTNIQFAGCLTGYAMRNIDSVMKTRAMDLLRGEDPIHDVCRKKACLEIPAKNRFCIRFTLKRSPCEESQRSSQRMLSDF